MSYTTKPFIQSNIRMITSINSYMWTVIEAEDELIRADVARLGVPGARPMIVVWYRDRDTARGKYVMIATDLSVWCWIDLRIDEQKRQRLYLMSPGIGAYLTVRDLEKIKKHIMSHQE